MRVARQTVTGPGYRFAAPAAWRVSTDARVVRVQSSSARPAAVSVTTYVLGKRYTPADFAAAAKELDGVAARLARASGGKVTASETARVDGRKIRAYRFTAVRKGGAYADRVGFVLAGKRELQLLCEAPAAAADPDGACAMLFATLKLTG